jgi:hypothetical protein
MSHKAIIICLALLVFTASCDLRSGTAKKEMERWDTTPDPAAPPPALPAHPEPKIEDADIVQVDISLSGETVSVNTSGQHKSAECKKFNALLINGSSNVVTVKGVCRQIMINGEGNQVTLDAAMSLVFNGSGNVVKYARFANGKRPTITENQGGNDIQKIAYRSGADKKSK